MARSMMMKLLVSIVAITMLFQLALAVDHDVGAPVGGWDTSTDLKSWASSNTFTVGDNLVFKFTSTHNVMEVSKDDYESCALNNQNSRNTDSPTTISLKEAGTRYFVCGTPGHCDQGMKVEITTVAAASGPPSTTTPPSSDSPPASPTPPSYAKPAPPVSTPGEPVQGGETVKPSPSSAATAKITVVSMVGMWFLMMI